MSGATYVGMETREFADVAAVADEVARRRTAFERIYLLKVLELEFEVFEIYLGCTRHS
jgi:hypothetical protein